MTDKKMDFAAGVFINRPHEKTTGFMFGKLSIHLDKFIAWAQQKENDKGYVNIDILISKGDSTKLYGVLNEYKKPESTTQPEKDPSIPW